MPELILGMAVVKDVVVVLALAVAIAVARASTSGPTSIPASSGTRSLSCCRPSAAGAGRRADHRVRPLHRARCRVFGGGDGAHIVAEVSLSVHPGAAAGLHRGRLAVRNLSPL
ncbi:MAG: hypothetical protein R3F60_27430 [bacterium]